METIITVFLCNYPVASVGVVIALPLLKTLWTYHMAVNQWFDKYVFNTLHDIPGAEKYEPGLAILVLGKKGSIDYIKHHFNENGKNEQSKYEYLKNTIDNPKYHYVFSDLCKQYNIKNTRLFRNFINGKAKQSMSYKRKLNAYIKAIDHAQKTHEREMWNCWKLKDGY